MVKRCRYWQPLGMGRRRDGELLRAIGRRVRALRDQRGWSQEQLGANAKLQTATLSRIENAKASPDLTTLSSIADALGVTLAQLCDVNSAPPRPKLTDLEESLLESQSALAPHQQVALLRFVQEMCRAPTQSLKGDKSG